MVVAVDLSRGGGGAERDGRPALRRAAIVFFFASIAVNAVVGIAALLVGEFSELHGRILGTSLSVTGALLVALVCLPAWERHRLGPLPPVGVGLAVVAFILVVVGIWTGSDSETLGKLTGTFMALAAACAVACVLAYPALAPRFHLVLVAALVLLSVGAAMAIAGIWLQPESSWYARAFGVVAVLLASLAISIPVLHRIGGGPEPAADRVTISFCPFCGGEQRSEASQATTCERCGERFTVHHG